MSGVMMLVWFEQVNIGDAGFQKVDNQGRFDPWNHKEKSHDKMDVTMRFSISNRPSTVFTRIIWLSRDL